MDDVKMLCERLEASAIVASPLGRGTMREAATALTLAKARIRELEAALGVAHGGLRAGIAQYASRDFHGNEVAGDEQYPWVRAMQIGRDAAARALKEASE